MPAAVAIPFAIAAGGASVASSIISGRRQERAQERALRAQREAQGMAEARAISEQRRAQLATRRANQRGPDLPSLIGSASGARTRGAASTLLTGAAGVNRERLILGSTSLLGG